VFPYQAEHVVPSFRANRLASAGEVNSASVEPGRFRPFSAHGWQNRHLITVLSVF